jgi:hypothetical protein
MIFPAIEFVSGCIPRSLLKDASLPLQLREGTLIFCGAVNFWLFMLRRLC